MSIEEGSTCIVTGSSSGIGKAVATELARMGSRVVMVSRTRERGRKALVEVCQASGNTQVDLLVADLSEMAEVRALAAKIRERYPQIDVLVNNAGGIFRPRQVTAEGLERTFALNHLGYFVLATELESTLRASAPCRVINVASAAHRRGRFRFDDLQLEKRYSPWRAYAQSKLANVAFTLELARRLEGTGVAVHAVHPGTVATGFGRNNAGLFRMLVRAGSPFMRTPEDGARTVVWLASSEDLDGQSGGYWADEKRRKPSKAALDSAVGRRLWDASLEILSRLSATAAADDLWPEPEGAQGR